MTDEPAPREAIQDLGVELTKDAEQLADRVVRLRLVHERAVAKEHQRETPEKKRDD